MSSISCWAFCLFILVEKTIFSAERFFIYLQFCDIGTNLKKKINSRRILHLRKKCYFILIVSPLKTETLSLAWDYISPLKEECHKFSVGQGSYTWQKYQFITTTYITWKYSKHVLCWAILIIIGKLNYRSTVPYLQFQNPNIFRNWKFGVSVVLKLI